METMEIKEQYTLCPSTWLYRHSLAIEEELVEKSTEEELERENLTSDEEDDEDKIDIRVTLRLNFPTLGEKLLRLLNVLKLKNSANVKAICRKEPSFASF